MQRQSFNDWLENRDLLDEQGLWQGIKDVGSRVAQGARGAVGGAYRGLTGRQLDPKTTQQVVQIYQDLEGFKRKLEAIPNPKLQQDIVGALNKPGKPGENPIDKVISMLGTYWTA